MRGWLVIKMETDQICMEMDLDIWDIRLSIFFLFPSLMMETDRIRLETDLDISDIHFPISHPFPLLAGQVHNVSLCLRDHEHTTRAASQVFGSPRCFSVISHLHDVW